MRTSTRLKLAYAAIAIVDATLAGSRRRGAHRARALTKPLLMPTLAASLVTAPRPAGTPPPASTLVAQAAGWCGDLALLGDEPQHFVTGSRCFAVGHGAYVTGFLRHRSARPRPGARLLLGGWALASPAIARTAARHGTSVGVALTVYSGALTSMAAAATQLDPAVPRDARRATISGALLFLVSDSILGARRFVLADPPAWTESAVMATYTAAQYLLSEGASRACASTEAAAR